MPLAQLPVLHQAFGRAASVSLEGRRRQEALLDRCLQMLVLRRHPYGVRASGIATAHPSSELRTVRVVGRRNRLIDLRLTSATTGQYKKTADSRTAAPEPHNTTSDRCSGGGPVMRCRDQMQKKNRQGTCQGLTSPQQPMSMPVQPSRQRRRECDAVIGCRVLGSLSRHARHAEMHRGAPGSIKIF